MGLKCGLRAFLPFVLLLFTAQQLQAADVRFSWDAGIQPNLEGYRIYYGTASRTYSAFIDVRNATSYTWKDLPPGIYFFAVTSYDVSGYESDYSDELYATVNTPGVGPNLLSLAGAPAIVPSETTAAVSWSTNFASTSLVEYGTTIAYGNQTTLDASYVLSHSQMVTGLLPGTVYHFVVRSQDAFGNLAISGDLTFTTLQPGSQTKRTLLFPHVPFPNGTNSVSTGLAITNLDSSDAYLTFSAFDQAGKLLSGAGITNPFSLPQPLKPGQQLPILDWQLFGSALPPEFSGWIEVASTAAKTVGFFLSLNSSLTVMDGAAGCYLPLRSVILPEVAEQGFTTIAIVNPGSSDADVTFEMVHGTDGIRATRIRKISARGALIADAFLDLFPDIPPDASLYMRASSAAPLAYFQFFGKQNTDCAALGGQDVTSMASTLYAPQYVVGNSWTTDLSLINLDSISDTVVIRLVGEDGTQLGSARSLPIGPNGKIHIADPGFFSVPLGSLVQGYIEIKSSRVRLAGSVVFGDNARTRYSAALPLTSTLDGNSVLLHIASNQTYYTGLAMLNPGSYSAIITLDLYDAAGNRKSSAMELIPPGQRMSKLLTQYFPELLDQDWISGSLRVRSSTGVAVFALFGTKDLTSLAAIAAEIVR